MHRCSYCSQLVVELVDSIEVSLVPVLALAGYDVFHRYKQEHYKPPTAAKAALGLAGFLVSSCQSSSARQSSLPHLHEEA